MRQEFAAREKAKKRHNQPPRTQRKQPKGDYSPSPPRLKASFYEAIPSLTTGAFIGTNPRRRQRWVNVRFGLELQAEFRIDGKLRYHFD